MPLDIVRWGGLAGMVTGGVFVLSSALSLAIRGPYSFLDAVFVSAWLLALVTVAGIYGLLGRAGSLILPARIVGSTVGTAALVVGTASFAWLAFLGARCSCSSVSCSWASPRRERGCCPARGVALIIALPLTAVARSVLRAESDFGGYPGVVVMSVVWLALGYVLWVQRAAHGYPHA